MVNCTTESSNDIKHELDNFESKMDNIELVTSPQSCSELVSQGINQSETVFLDPDGRHHGFAPIPVLCKLPEALAISGKDIEVPMEPICADTGCFFNHEIDYDNNTMEQLIALTRVSSKCTQTLDFHCFSAPLKDPVR